MALKDNIKAKRLEAGMTLEELSKKVGVSRQTIHRYESGVINNIPSDNIEKIAQALNTTPQYLMGWEEDHNHSVETIAAHRTDDPTKDLPEEARQSIEDFKKFIFEKHGIKYD